ISTAAAAVLLCCSTSVAAVFRSRQPPPPAASSVLMQLTLLAAADSALLQQTLFFCSCFMQLLFLTAVFCSCCFSATAAVFLLLLQEQSQLHNSSSTSTILGDSNREFLLPLTVLSLCRLLGYPSSLCKSLLLLPFAAAVVVAAASSYLSSGSFLNLFFHSVRLSIHFGFCWRFIDIMVSPVSASTATSPLSHQAGILFQKLDAHPRPSTAPDVHSLLCIRELQWPLSFLKKMK
ncbi:UNVERIFIED_CONTAM: hypothetical protein Sindi_0935600, partial [Sesamum indicum]